MQLNISFDILAYLGLIFCGMVGSIAASALAFILSLAGPNGGGWKPIIMIGYAVTTGLFLSFLVSAVAAGVWLAVCSTTGSAFWCTVATTFIVRLLVCISEPGGR